MRLVTNWIEDGARLNIQIRERFGISDVINHIMELNPDVNEDRLKSRVKNINADRPFYQR